MRIVFSDATDIMQVKEQVSPEVDDSDIYDDGANNGTDSTTLDEASFQ